MSITLNQLLIDGWEDRGAMAMLSLGEETLITIATEMRAEVKRQTGEDLSEDAIAFLFGAAFGLGFAVGEL